jgi:signal transduction histidine kinase
MLTGAILLAITSAIAFFVAMIVGMAHTVSRKVKFAFAIVLLSLALWQITIFIADHTRQNLLLWNQLVFLWPTLAALSFYIFTALLRPSAAEPKLLQGKRMYLSYIAIGLAVLVQLISVASGRIFSSITYDTSASEYIFERGDFYALYIIGFIVLLFLVLARLLANFANSERYPTERRALKTVITTVALAVVYGLTTNILLPLLTDSQNYISFGLATVDIFAIGLAFSIIRHQFLEIKTYVFRAVVYLVVLLFAALLYAGAASILTTYLLETSLKPTGVFVLSVVTLMIAVSFQPLRIWFDRQTSRIFFRDYYSQQDVLDQLGRLLVGAVDLDEIQQSSEELLGTALKPTFLKYLLAAEKPKDHMMLLKQMQQTDLNVIVPYDLQQEHQSSLVHSLKQEDIALAIRLRTKHEDLGFLVLGSRRSGGSYSLADRKFLGLVADQVAIGLQNALRFQEIEKFNQTLQDKIEVATQRLRRTNDKLRTLDQTKDDFISMASHQLRTPLTSVKGYVSMVLEGDAGRITPMQRRLLNQSFISSQRMVYLISDLLNVSRLRTGKFIIEPVRTNLATVIKGEIEQLVETAKSRNLELVYNKPEHFPTYMLDETKLRQVIMNFVDNAIYYTPSGGRITVSLEEKPQSIEFTVNDTGMGVPKHDQPHLFTKFFRAHNAKRARPDGTGLGLFMAKKVIIAQGGAIIFKSQEGKGSTFGFTFAKDRLQTPPAPPAHHTEVKE